MKRILCTILIVILVMPMTGCQSTDKHETTSPSQVSGGSMIDIYYPDGNMIIKSETKYQIKQPDSITASIEEVMAALLKEFGGRMPFYTYMLDDKNNVSLELTLDNSYSKEDYLLIMAAVTNTVFQVKDIGGIDITILDNVGDVVAENLFVRDSFYFYDYPQDDNYNSVEVEIYSAGSDGINLVKSQTTLYYELNVSLEENIVLYLASIEAIPSSTEVNSVSVSGGICYLDLNSNFEKNMTNIKSDVVVYSVVNSITSLDNIDKVQILIDGVIISDYRKTVATSSPLSFNAELVE